MENEPELHSRIPGWALKLIGGAVVLAAIAVVVVQFARPHPAPKHAAVEQDLYDAQAVANSGAGVDAGSARPWRRIFQAPGHIAHRKSKTGVSCSDCHQQRGKEYDHPGPDRCAICHDGVEAKVHAHGGPKGCVDCHTFRLAEGAEPQAWNCMTCHDKPQGDAVAVAVHADAACGDCHKPHSEPTLQPRDCAECHENLDVKHGSATGARACTGCHSPHEKAGTSERCGTCHSKRRPVIPATATFSGGHETCGSCHEAHQFTKKAAARCASCHESRPALAAAKVSQHAQCSSCHSPHDVRAGAREACGRCHAKLRPDHPVGKEGACAGCHPAHPKGGGKHTAACSSCHPKAANDGAFHAGGVSCTDCHAPHAFRKPGQCGECHSDQADKTAKNAGHSRCAICHDGHKPSAKPPGCEKCHAAVVKAAPEGHDCTNCHEPHAGKQTAKANCLECHDDKKAALHGSIKGGCRTCHSPHRKGATADCARCHAPARLGGKHAVEAHQADCTACHGGHSAPRADRKTCLECHTDKADHQKAQPSCAKCHPFKQKAGG